MTDKELKYRIARLLDGHGYSTSPDNIQAVWCASHEWDEIENGDDLEAELDVAFSVAEAAGNLTKVED